MEIGMRKESLRSWTPRSRYIVPTVLICFMSWLFPVSIFFSGQKQAHADDSVSL